MERTCPADVWDDCNNPIDPFERRTTDVAARERPRRPHACDYLHLQLISVHKRERVTSNAKRRTSGETKTKPIEFITRATSWTCRIVTNKRTMRARPRAHMYANSRSAVSHVSYNSKAWIMSTCPLTLVNRVGKPTNRSQPARLS